MVSTLGVWAWCIWGNFLPSIQFTLMLGLVLRCIGWVWDGVGCSGEAFMVSVVHEYPVVYDVEAAPNSVMDNACRPVII